MRNSVVNTARLLVPLACLLFLAGCKTEDGQPINKVALDDSRQRFAYSAGVMTGRDLRRDELDLDIDALLIGLQDGLEQRAPRLTAEEMEKLRLEFRKGREAAQKQKLAANLAAAEEFLRSNAGKPGVLTLPSGLQYREIKAGVGAKPGVDSNVKAHYVVRTIDGKVLESTYDKGQPAIFPVSAVMPAWAEALPLMKEGAKWELFIPPSLAYGDKGVPGAVEPNQALVCEIEFIAVH